MEELLDQIMLVNSVVASVLILGLLIVLFVIVVKLTYDFFF